MDPLKPLAPVAIKPIDISSKVKALPQLTPPVPSGTGLERLILAISIGLGKAENAIMDVTYGSADPLGGIKFPGNNKKTQGLLPILREINKIDICNVINYFLGTISLTDGVIGEKLTKVREKAKEVLDFLDGNYLDTSTAKNPERVNEIIGYLAELDELIDSEICTIFPKIQTFKNNLHNSVGELTQYNAAVASYNILSEVSGSNEVISVVQSTPQFQLAIAEFRRLAKVIREVKEVLGIIINATSVGDLTSRIIPNEIQELQKIINPAKLVPVLKSILALARGLNQVTKQILGYINVARTIVQVLSLLLKVTKIAIKIFNFNPAPAMFVTLGVIDLTIKGRQTLEEVVDTAEKRVGQIGRLIEVVYAFCLTLATIIEDVIQQIEVLIFTLESCNPTPIVRELKDAKAKLQASLAAIQAVTANYEKAKASANQTTYNGYTLVIEEEEVEEVTITYKRRRAIAYDYRGVMVMATDLTFATDNTILFEELRLKLVNAGLTQDTGGTMLGLRDLSAIFQLPESTEDIYASIGMTTQNGLTPEDQMKAEMKVVQAQISTVISNITGGDELKKLSYQSVSSGSAALKANIQSGVIDPTANQQLTGGLTKATNSYNVVAETINPDILTDAEVTRLEAFVKSTKEGPKSGFLTQTAVYKNAVRKLELNKAAREAGKK